MIFIVTSHLNDLILSNIYLVRPYPGWGYCKKRESLTGGPIKD